MPAPALPETTRRVSTALDTGTCVSGIQQFKELGVGVTKQPQLIQPEYPPEGVSVMVEVEEALDPVLRVTLAGAVRVNPPPGAMASTVNVSLDAP